MGYVELDFSAIPFSMASPSPIDHGADLRKNSKGEKDTFLRRRIHAIGVGVFNGFTFTEDEVKKMVQASHEQRDKEKTKYFKVPIVLDHSNEFLKKVGATFDLRYDKKEGAVADIELWDKTPAQEQTQELVKLDPENTFFSVRVRGKEFWDEENGAIGLMDLRLIHIAIVNEPADANARILGELSRDPDSNEAEPDFSLSPSEANTGNMPEQEITDLKKENETLQTSVASLTEQVKSLQQEKTSLEADLSKTREKITQYLQAEIKAVDNGVNEALLTSMNIEQLMSFREEVARIRGVVNLSDQQQQSGSPHTTETTMDNGSSAGGATNLSLEEQADAIFGAL